VRFIGFCSSKAGSLIHLLKLAIDSRIIPVERLISQVNTGGYMSKISKWGVMALSVALLGSILVPAIAQGRLPGMRQARQNRMAPLIRNENVQKELGLTADQVDRLRQLRRKLSVAGIESRSQLQIKRLELQDLMAAKTLDRVAIDKKVQEISVLRGTQMKNMIEMRLGLQGILTPEQMAKAKEMRGNAIRQRIGQQRALRNPDARPARPAVARRRQGQNDAPPAPAPPPIPPSQPPI
jgi:Spy/CpxP family protein refolding chaperone